MGCPSFPPNRHAEAIQQDVVVIGITGMPGAQKTKVAQMLSEKGLPSYRMSKVLEQEIELRGLPRTPQTFWSLAEDLRRKYGNDIVAKRCWDSVSHSEPLVVIDGIRNQAEVAFFRRVSRQFVLLLVHSAPSTRFRRLKERYPFYGEYTRFRESEEHNLSLGISYAIAIADYAIINERYSKRSLEEQTDDFFEFVVGGDCRNSRSSYLGE